MTQTILSGLETVDSVLVVIPPDNYPQISAKLSEELAERYLRITYISLNKLITILRKSLQSLDLDLSKFYVIDGITKTAIASPPPVDQCVFIPVPNDLTKLGIAFTNNLSHVDPDCVFFDSLSTLLIYEDPSVVTQFVYSLINKVHASGIKIVFTCLAGSREETLINNLSLLVDKVIRVQSE